MADRTSKFRNNPNSGCHPPHPADPRRLEEKESILRSLLALSDEGVFLIQGGRVAECNRFLAEKAGYAAEEVVGSIFASFFDTQSIGKIEPALAENACPAANRVGFRVRLICKNGDTYNVRFKSQACVIGGESAHLVVLSESGQPAPAAEWALDWQDGFFPEEFPVRIPECGCC